MRYFILFLVSVSILGIDFKLKDLEGLTGEDFYLSKDLVGEALQDYLNREAKFSGLKRMTRSQWNAIPESKLSVIPDKMTNNHADLSDFMPPVGRQTKNDCATWSGGYYIKSYQENIERGWSIPSSTSNNAPHIMSPAFLYNNTYIYTTNWGARVTLDQNNNPSTPCIEKDGMYLENVATILQNQGIVPLSSMPYQTSQNSCEVPTSAQINLAKTYRIDSYSKVSGFSNFRRQLDAGNPIHIGIKMSVAFGNTWGFSGIYRTMPAARTTPCTKMNNVDSCQTSAGNGLECVNGFCEAAGAHAIVIVGYDQRNGKDTFKIINSWGESWGTNGYLEMDADVLKVHLERYQGIQGLVYTDHVEAQCNDLCAANSYQCRNNNLQRCVRNTRGCLEWKVTQNCGNNICNENTKSCESSNNCQGACSLGQKQCSLDNNYEQICVRGNSCNVFSNNKRCQNGCENGSCKSDGGNNDVCAGLTCSHRPNSECVNNNGRAVCACKSGFKWNSNQTACIRDGNGQPCDGVTCSNHGQCILLDGNEACNCENGYHEVGLTCIINDGGECQSDCSRLREETCRGNKVLTCLDNGQGCLRYVTRNPSCGAGWECSTANLNDDNVKNDCVKSEEGTGCDKPNSLSGTTTSSYSMLILLFFLSLFFIRRKNN